MKKFQSIRTEKETVYKKVSLLNRRPVFHWINMQPGSAQLTNHMRAMVFEVFIGEGDERLVGHRLGGTLRCGWEIQ